MAFDRASAPDAPQTRAFVRDLFRGIAPVYDLGNRLLSWGRDRAWRRALVADLPREGVLVDGGAGTCDVGLAYLARRDARGYVVCADVTRELLVLGRAKLDRAGHAGRFACVLCDASALPFRDASAVAVTSAFMLRHIAERGAFWRECARVLADGGRLALLEIAAPRSRVIAWAFDAYFARIAPAVMRAVSRHDYGYAYLPASLEGFPSPERLAIECAAHPFDAPSARRFWPDASALVTATRRAR